MKLIHLGRLLQALFLAGSSIATVAAEPPAGSALEGRWSGTMVQPSERFQVAMEIRRTADGRLEGSFRGVDRSNAALSIDAVEQNGTTVRLVVGVVSGGFEGVLSPDGTRLTGNWSELAITTPLELTRSPAQPPADNGERG